MRIVERVFKFQKSCRERRETFTLQISCMRVHVSMHIAWFVIISLSNKHVYATRVSYAYMKNMIYRFCCVWWNKRWRNFNKCSQYAHRMIYEHDSFMHVAWHETNVHTCVLRCFIVRCASCVNRWKNVLFSRVTRSICVRVWMCHVVDLRALHAHIRVFRHVLTYKRCICVNIIDICRTCCM